MSPANRYEGLEHDTHAERAKEKPRAKVARLKEEPETQERQALKAKSGRAGRPWLHPDNPALWVGDPAIDD